MAAALYLRVMRSASPPAQRSRVTRHCSAGTVMGIQLGVEYLVLGALQVPLAEVRCGERLVNVADDVRPVLQVDRDLNHVHTHGDHVAAGGAVVAGAGVALQCVRKVSPGTENVMFCREGICWGTMLQHAGHRTAAPTYPSRK